MEKSKLDRFIAFMVLVIVLMLVYLGVVVLVFFRNKTMPIHFYTNTDYLTAVEILEKEYDKNEEVKSNSYYKSKIEKDFKLNCYIYSEKKLKSHNGVTFPTIRTIIIRQGVGGYEYCETLAHETIHLKEFIKQEDYVSYKTFLYLYESEELHNVGVWFGLRQLYGYYSGEYNVADYIVNYLTKE